MSNLRAIVLACVSIALCGYLLAETRVEGLKKPVPAGYNLQIEISHRNFALCVISVRPVDSFHELAITKRDGASETVVSTRITEAEYTLMCDKAHDAIANFEFLAEPLEVSDALNYELSLSQNGRGVSVKYSGIPHLGGASPAMEDVVELAKEHLPNSRHLVP